MFWYVRDEILLEKTSGKQRHVYLMTHAIVITKLPRPPVGAIYKKRKEKFLALLDLGRVVVRSSGELEFTLTNNYLDKKTYRFSCPSCVKPYSPTSPLLTLVKNGKQSKLDD